ncbi:MAG: hypothetical protein SFZ23_10370 [Planctomycetota bacterium]|nr:hypothetical protein [Planctomycetota bacterium]
MFLSLSSYVSQPLEHSAFARLDSDAPQIAGRTRAPFNRAGVSALTLIALAGLVTGIVASGSLAYASEGAAMAEQVSPGASRGAGAGEGVAGGPGTGRSGAAALTSVNVSSAQVPIRRITLYRSGVASVLRRGEVEGDATVQLRFQTDQINDVLKSMVVLDLSKGRGEINSISYPSKDPLSRQLASFGVDISDNPSLAEIAERLRGSVVTAITNDGVLTGTILGVEQRPELPPDARVAIQVPYINILTPTGIRAIGLHAVSSLQLQDPALAEELNKALAAVAAARTERLKAVDVSLTGEGSRDIAIAYVHETPVWKASYRLILPDDAKQAATPPQSASASPGTNTPSTIQGWAIVENTTDEDWTDVRLSLVSGRPVSFEMDLYQPLYLARPQVPVPVELGVGPRVYEEGAAADQALVVAQPGLPGGNLAAKRRGREPASPPAPAATPAAGVAMQSMDALEQGAMAEYAPRAQAQGVQTGEVFQYELSNPVTVARQRSAMLPIIASAIGAERVSIFNRGEGAAHPMRGVRLKNTTGLHLLPGPLSIFEDNTYAGDAQVGHVSPGDSRLISYAVDLDVAVIAADSAERRVTRVRLSGGLLEEQSKQVLTTTYRFSNKDQRRGRTIIVEQAKAEGELIKPAKAVDETQNLFRFEVAVDAGSPATLEVVQEQVLVQRYSLFSYDQQTLLQLARSGTVSEAVLKSLREAGAKQAAVFEADRRIEQIEKEISEIRVDQTRIRENMGSIDRTSDLYRRYMVKLTEQESKLENLEEELKRTRQSREAGKKALDEFVAGLNVD